MYNTNLLFRPPSVSDEKLLKEVEVWMESTSEDRKEHDNYYEKRYDMRPTYQKDVFNYLIICSLKNKNNLGGKKLKVTRLTEKERGKIQKETEKKRELVITKLIETENAWRRSENEMRDMKNKARNRIKCLEHKLKMKSYLIKCMSDLLKNIDKLLKNKCGVSTQTIFMKSLVILQNKVHININKHNKTGGSDGIEMVKKKVFEIFNQLITVSDEIARIENDLKSDISKYNITKNQYVECISQLKEYSNQLKSRINNPPRVYPVNLLGTNEWNSWFDDMWNEWYKSDWKSWWDIWKNKSLINLDGAYLPNLQLQGFHLTDVNLSNANISKSDLSYADIDCAKLWATNLASSILSHTNLTGANCQYVDFSCLNESSIDGHNHIREVNKTTGSDIYSGAKLDTANLSGTDCQHAKLSGASLPHAKLHGANFSYASSDSKTELILVKRDKYTNFTGVSLSTVQITPQLQTDLERNIREIHWEHWYRTRLTKWRNEQWFNPGYDEDGVKKKHRKFIYFMQFCSIPFVYLFWSISNYGVSTLRVILSFIILNVCATVCYYVLSLNGIQTFLTNYLSTYEGGIDMLWKSFACSSTLMFGITPDNFSYFSSDWWVVLIMFIHIILGYVILAALITRITVMFQNKSP